MLLLAISMKKIDGVQLNDNDLILIKDQTNKNLNGIYRFDATTIKLVSLINLNNMSDFETYVFNNNQF